MFSGYVELHAKSFYSFGLGASHTHELLAQAGEYGYPALALTDTNLCGALEFARLARSLEVQPITGGELTLTDGSRLVLLAKTSEGYSNISRLFTLAAGGPGTPPAAQPGKTSNRSGWGAWPESPGTPPAAQPGKTSNRSGWGAWPESPGTPPAAQPGKTSNRSGWGAWPESRREPRLDLAHLPQHCQGVVMLTGGRDGQLARLVLDGRHQEAQNLLRQYMEWFGADSVYVELQQNFLQGDTRRNRELAGLAGGVGVPLVATNDVHYHCPQRYRLQHALAAAKRNTTIDQALPFIRPNHHLYLKSQAQMERLFRGFPEAVANTLGIARLCAFDLSADLGYTLPDPAVPEGYTPASYLRQLCHEAAIRRYGSVSRRVEERLQEEFRLIEAHGLAGFLLLYREIVLIAQRIMEEQGMMGPETPLEERPPGRGRGSSVALLVGYLIGISHVDPLQWNLTLERFISEDTSMLPDIDLDFPRNLRDELIERVHRHFGPEFAVLAGAITTYKVKGAIQDLGKALGLPGEELKLLSKQLHSHDAARLRDEMLELPDFRDRVEAPGWKALLELAPQLMDAPKLLSQHVGGMVLSSSPIPEMVPVRHGAIEGRFIMDWNKDSVSDANFAKIDILSLPVLDQIEEALRLIEQREGKRPDLSRIDPEDPGVYDMINAGQSKGVFLLQSPAQLKMGQRLRSRRLLDLAYQVALIRPGVGVQGSAVAQFVERYRHGAPWEYDHPLEARALERGYGIIVWQEQVVQLIMDVGNMTAAQADEVRRAFARPNSQRLIAGHWQRFLEGARQQGVTEEVARKIFAKINGHYMFPESHSHAFAITAYQAAWLKRYYPLEFFVTLMNNQPMGFYPMETLKQDARRFGVPFLNPCVNRSGMKCIPEQGSVLLGLQFIKDVGRESARLIVDERERNGPYVNAGDLVRRTGLKPQAVLSLVLSGACDSLSSVLPAHPTFMLPAHPTINRRAALWEAGLYTRPTRNGQMALPWSMGESVPQIEDFTDREKMVGEYVAMGIYPRGHLMEFVRPGLSPQVLTTVAVEQVAEGEEVLVAGWPVARQHPRGQDSTVFVTIEDEVGDLQLVIWPQVFTKRRRELGSQVILARGVVSRWDGTTNVVVSDVKGVHARVPMPRSHDWR